MTKKTDQERVQFIRSLKLERIHKIKSDKRKKAQIAKERVQEYYEARVKGKTSQQDVAMSVKDDFLKFAARKGGIFNDIAQAFDNMVKKR